MVSVAGVSDFRSSRGFEDDGAVAEDYKGTGQLNGGGYGFMLTLRDGDECGSPTPDGFRIKITGAGEPAVRHDAG